MSEQHCKGIEEATVSQNANKESRKKEPGHLLFVSGKDSQCHIPDSMEGLVCDQTCDRPDKLIRTTEF